MVFALRSGIDATFAPHAMPNLSGGVEGFNVDLANEIAKRLGRKLELDAGQFSGLVPALQAGTYEFLAAAMTVTKERAENMLFTEGYVDTDYQFVVKKETPDIKSLEELRGKTISVNKGAIYDQWARGRVLRDHDRRRASRHLRARLYRPARQHGRGLGGEEQSRAQALPGGVDRSRLCRSGAQGQYGPA